MKNDKDPVIILRNEWTTFTTTLNWDADGMDHCRVFAELMRLCSFSTSSIIECFREIADELEEDAKFVKSDDEEQDNCK